MSRTERARVDVTTAEFVSADRQFAAGRARSSSREFDPEVELGRRITNLRGEHFELLTIHAPEDGFVPSRVWSERLILVGDVAVDAVVLDEFDGVPPVGETLWIMGRRAERALHARESVEFVAMVGDVVAMLVVLVYACALEIPRSRPASSTLQTRHSSTSPSRGSCIATSLASRYP